MDKKNERLPPQAIEAERAVLGALLISPKAIDEVADILTADDFYNSKHNQIYAVCVELYRQNIAIDIITIANYLSETNRLAQVGGRLYLAELLETVASAANVRYHAEIVREKSIRRRIITAGTELCRSAYEDGETEEILAQAETRIFELSTPTGPETIEGAELLAKILLDAEARVKDGSKLRGLSTGFPSLDRIMGGMEGGNSIVIGGYTSHGKTSLAMNIAANVAKAQHHVGVFSLEMSAEQLCQRMLCSIIGVNLFSLRTGRLSPQELELAAARAYEVENVVQFIHIDEHADLSALALRAKARRMKQRHDIDLLVIDYLQLMAGGAKETGYERVTRCSSAVKACAKELNIPALLLSQLHRSQVPARDKTPKLNQFRQSGEIEEHTDVGLLVYREELDNPGKRVGEADIIIAKNRNGPTGKITMMFKKETTTFYEAETDQEQGQAGNRYE